MLEPVLLHATGISPQPFCVDGMQEALHSGAGEPPAFQQMQPQLAAEAILNAVQQLQSDMKQHQLGGKHIKGLESKLSTLEASVLATGMRCWTYHQALPCDDLATLRVAHK